MNEQQPSENQVVIQSHYGVTLTFEFRPEDLHYIWRGPADALSFATPYEDIWVKSPSYLTVDSSAFAQRFYLAYLVLTTALIATILYFRLDPGLASVALILSLVGFLILRMKAPFSLHFVLLAAALDPAAGIARELRIFEDEAGQEILAEIERRWRARLRALHAFVDPASDPAAEAGKFDWLRQNDVIDDAEYEAAMAELREAGLGAGRSVH